VGGQKGVDLQGLKYAFEGHPGSLERPLGTYDPRAQGCRCDVCPLGNHLRSKGEWKPVKAEMREGTAGAIVGESPGGKEVKEGRPFAGRSGWKLNEVLEKNGLSRNQFDIGNAICCRPPGDNMGRFLAQLQRVNKKRKDVAQAYRKAGGPLPLPNEMQQIPSPIECCRPQFTELVKKHNHFLLLGASAYEALTRKALVDPQKLAEQNDERVAEGEKVVGVEKAKRKAIRMIRGSLIEFWVEDKKDEAGNPVYVLARKDEGSESLMRQGMRSIKVVPALHPAFILRSPEWEDVLAQDVGRFWRWINGVLRWVPPKKVFLPSPTELEAFLYGPSRFLAYDIETDGKDSLTCRMRCIGIGNEEVAYLVPFLGIKYDVSIDGWNCGKAGSDYGRAWYSPEDAHRIRQILIRWLTDPNRPKTGHNNGSFDTQVLKRELLGGAEPQGQYDNILFCRANNSDLPRDLYTTGTLYTDVPDWKAADGDRKIAVNPRSDEELWGYCLVDVVVTARCFPPLWAGAERRGQLPVLAWDHRTQYACREMTRVGMYVDQGTRARGEEWLTARSEVTLRKIRDLLGNPKFNPHSGRQMNVLVYDDWRFPILRETDTGDPSSDDDCLRDFVIKKVATGKQVEAIKLIRSYRGDKKLLGTYFKNARPMTMRWYDIDPLTGKKKGNHERHGWAMADGRLHCGFNSHTASTGRTSSSKPMNAQNFPLIAKMFITAAPGNLLVGADFDQIELRLFALIAGLTVYLKEFQKPDCDPHTLTATLIYGVKFSSLDKKHPGRKRLRTIAKSFTYAVLYGASIQTIYETLSAAEDPKTGDLLFPDLTLEEVRAIYNSWMAGAPEVEAYWETVWAFAKLHGYVTEPVMGRRRDFPQFERNETINLGIQGGARAIMTVALNRLTTVIPWEAYGPGTGLINECHDAVTFEVPERHAEEVAALCKEHMAVEIPHMKGMTFTAKPDIGWRWSEV